MKQAALLFHFSPLQNSFLHVVSEVTATQTFIFMWSPQRVLLQYQAKKGLPTPRVESAVS